MNSSFWASSNYQQKQKNWENEICLRDEAEVVDSSPAVTDDELQLFQGNNKNYQKHYCSRYKE